MTASQITHLSTTTACFHCPYVTSSIQQLQVKQQ